jgi:hypothetical protein
VEYTGRKRVPIKKKLNPVWWFGNDHEQKVTDPDAAWYLPRRPEWQRELMWSLRNPLQNFRAYVIGVQDRNYRVKVVRGHPDANVVQRDDVGESGWQVAMLHFPSRVQLPWLSYSGRRLVFQAGWQPSGFFGLKLTVRTK